jgi:hypothetical protein
MLYLELEGADAGAKKCAFLLLILSATCRVGEDV